MMRWRYFRFYWAESPNQVLEIGTYMGHTARAMAENLENATIHAIDLPSDFSASEGVDNHLPKDDYHLIGRRILGREFKGQPCESRIVQHFPDTAVRDFAQIWRPSFFFITAPISMNIARAIPRNA
jgi:hypothetical protein